MQTLSVQVNYKNGEVGTYVCTKRPYFNYENNTAMLHLENGSTIVVNMLECISVTY